MLNGKHKNCPTKGLSSMNWNHSFWNCAIKTFYHRQPITIEDYVIPLPFSTNYVPFLLQVLQNFGLDIHTTSFRRPWFNTKGPIVIGLYQNLLLYFYTIWNWFFTFSSVVQNLSNTVASSIFFFFLRRFFNHFKNQYGQG